VIGRHPTCDLQIKDGLISRRHASVIRNGPNWYIKDLESTSGIFYKGMQIDNKRIEEGDTFLVGPYELRFTFRR
jgi:pSer/pThr/pTyr-binding forkhead associated (FHA) protein